MPIPPLVIRVCTKRDWPAVFEIFRDVVEAGETYAYTEGLTSDQAKSLWFEQPPGETVVAAHDGEIVGSAKFGPNRPGRGSHVATASYMVSASARGRGVGRALCVYSLDWARGHGFRAVQFNAVVATNLAAIRLYESLSFAIVGTVPRSFISKAEGPVDLHVMYLEL